MINTSKKSRAAAASKREPSKVLMSRTEPNAGPQTQTAAPAPVAKRKSSCSLIFFCATAAQRSSR